MLSQPQRNGRAFARPFAIIMDARDKPGHDEERVPYNTLLLSFTFSASR